MYELGLRSAVPDPPAAEVERLGGAQFDRIGQEFFGHLRNLAGLQPTHAVLDAGCGIGRMARPLYDFLEGPGSYDGFDVERHCIDWCTDHVTPARPRFRFRLLDARNSVYNPTGTVPPDQVRFPYDDASFDVALLASVFTHLLPATTTRYVEELSRVMRPGGRVLATFFLLTPEVEASVDAGKSRIGFAHRREGHRLDKAEHPEAAVAYPADDITALFARNGFTVVDKVHRGSWSGLPDGLSFQDIVVVERTRA